MRLCRSAIFSLNAFRASASSRTQPGGWYSCCSSGSTSSSARCSSVTSFGLGRPQRLDPHLRVPAAQLGVRGHGQPPLRLGRGLPVPGGRPSARPGCFPASGRRTPARGCVRPAAHAGLPARRPRPSGRPLPRLRCGSPAAGRLPRWPAHTPVPGRRAWAPTRSRPGTGRGSATASRPPGPAGPFRRPGRVPAMPHATGPACPGGLRSVRARSACRSSS